jgi:hypothetical protein
VCLPPFKVEFRENAREEDPAKVATQRLVAQRSYGQLLSYVGLDSTTDRDWDVTMAQEPMPRN